MLGYKYAPVTIAYTVLDWIVFSLMVGTTYYVSRAARHVLKEGPAQGVEPGLPERLGHQYLGRFIPTKGQGNKFRATEEMTESSNTANERI